MSGPRQLCRNLVARDNAAADGGPTTVVIKALNTFLQGTPDMEMEQTLVENFQMKLSRSIGCDTHTSSAAWDTELPSTWRVPLLLHRLG